MREQSKSYWFLTEGEKKSNCCKNLYSLPPSFASQNPPPSSLGGFGAVLAAKGAEAKQGDEKQPHSV